MTEAKNTLDVKPVNVREVVDAIKNEVSQYSPENKMRINIDMPEQVDIEGNRQLIDAIFRNLVNNSIAYSGGRDIFISMDKETDDAYWFDVYDNGTGVEDKHLSRIFERRLFEIRCNSMGERLKRKIGSMPVLNLYFH